MFGPLICRHNEMMMRTIQTDNGFHSSLIEERGMEPTACRRRKRLSHFRVLNRVVPANLLLFSPFDRIIFADFVRLR